MTINYVAAFMLGFWGSLHCVGMCGGIVGVLNASLGVKDASPSRRWLMWLGYNSGRIFSYALAGAIAAFVGSSLFDSINQAQAHRIGMMLSGAFLIAFGLYLSGWWMGLGWIEKKGAVLWRKINKLSRHLLPVKQLHQAMLLGMLWGWLPCGLVYSVLVWSFTASTVMQGFLQMAAFGLGTLPMLLAMSGAANKITAMLTKSRVRQLAGVVVIVFGVATFLGVAPMHGHDHGSSEHSHHHH